MTEEQIEQKAKNVYIRCFDDDFEYSGVLHALEICAKETAAEATKELQEENENLRSIAEYQQSSNMKRGFEIKELKARINAINLLTPELEKLSKARKKQLTEAKDLIKHLCSMVRELNKPNVQLTNVDYSLSEAEQFLKEMEK